MNAEEYLKNVHPDLKNLLFIEKRTPENLFETKFEPSTIFIDLPVIEPQWYTSIIEPSKHFSPPTYATFMAEHKYQYFDFLSDPYAYRHYGYDDYYVLLLYYCLERHLFSGDFECAYILINKLKSLYFHIEKMVAQSDISIILTCLKRKRYSNLSEYIYNYSDRTAYCPIDILILAKYAVGESFTYKDILRYRFAFGYVVSDLPIDYGIFLKKLRENMIEETGLDCLEIDTLIQMKESMECEEVRVFLNNSLDITAQIPKFHKFHTFYDACFYFLNKTHEFFANPIFPNNKGKKRLTKP